MRWGVCFLRAGGIPTTSALCIIVSLTISAAPGWCGEPKAGPAGVAAPKSDEGDSVANPLAPGLMTLLNQEIRSGFQTRGTDYNFRRFIAYSGLKLDTTATYTNSEVTGNCRLSWYDYLLRHPLEAPTEAEKFTRQLHKDLRGDHNGLDRAMVLARAKVDAGARDPQVFPKITSAEQALEAIERALVGAQMGYAAAVAPLTHSELSELARNLYYVFVGNNIHGHTLDDRGTGRRLCDLMEKMDRRAMFAAADALAPLSDPELLKQLKSLPDDGDVKSKE